MKAIYKSGLASIITRVLLQDSASLTGGGKTGLTFASSGLIVATIADNEAAGAAYSGGNIETVTTLGTWVIPSAGKCRFREVDAVNFPGLYEVQLIAARHSVAGARALIVCVQADGVPATYAETELTDNVNMIGADLVAIGGDSGAANAFLGSVRAIARGSAGAGSTTTSITTGNLNPTLADANQLKGRIVIFDRDTATLGLRGEATDITASTTGGVLTVSPLTTAPAIGDQFGVY